MAELNLACTELRGSTLGQILCSVPRCQQLGVVSLSTRAFQWEDRSFSSQIEQQRFAYSCGGPPLKNSFFCVRVFIMCSCHHFKVTEAVLARTVHEAFYL